MGERLVLRYNIAETSKLYSVSIYQHWSGYTDSAIETANTIQGWINEFQNSPEFSNLSFDERFTTFVKALGSGKIIEGAYFTEASVKILNKLGFTEIEFDPTRISRNEGLIDVNEETDSAMSWGEMTTEYDDVPEWFSDEAAQPEQDDLSFYDLEILNIVTPENVNPFDLTLKDLILQNEQTRNVPDDVILDGLEYLSYDFDPDIVDEDEMPEAYNKTLRDYMAQELSRPTSFYDNSEDLNNVIKNENALEINHVLDDAIKLNDGKKLTTIYIYHARA